MADLTGTNGRSPARRRLHDFLLATLLGLSWFVLADASYRASRMLALAGWGGSAPSWHLLSSTRLLIGLAVYLPVAILVTSGSWLGTRGRLSSLGLLPVSTTMVVRALALIAMAIALGGPGAIWHRIGQHLGGSMLSVMGGLQPPAIEELLVRGIVWAVLARSFSPGVTLLWSTVLFGSWHLQFGVAAAGGTAFGAAMVCGLPRLASGLVWPGMVFHLMGNAGIGHLLIPPAALAGVFICWDVVKGRGGRTSACT